MTKKKLQKQIDELKEAVAFTVNRDPSWLGGYVSGYIQTLILGRQETGKRLKALEQYLNIEYKVTESKREEGYVKKEDVRLGITNGPFVSGPLIPLGKNTGKIMKK